MRPLVACLAFFALVPGACATSADVESPSTPLTAAGGQRTAPPPPDPSAVANAAAFGRWRPAPIAPTARLATAVEAACRADPATGHRPLVVMDVRGEGQVTVVFADMKDAVLCRATTSSEAGPIEVVVRPVAGAAGSAQPDEGTLGLHDLELVDTGIRGRFVLVGRVGDAVHSVGVNFEDATWSQAAMANGWYATWWSGTAIAIGVAASNTRNIVIDSFPP